MLKQELRHYSSTDPAETITSLFYDTIAPDRLKTYMDRLPHKHAVTLWFDDAWGIKANFEFLTRALVHLSKLHFELKYLVKMASDADDAHARAAFEKASHYVSPFLRERLLSGLWKYGCTRPPSSSISSSGGMVLSEEDLLQLACNICQFRLVRQETHK